MADWIKKQEPAICCLPETHLRAKDTHRLKVRGWKKIFYANGNNKKVGVAICISDKIDFFFSFFNKSLLEYNCFTILC